MGKSEVLLSVFASVLVMFLMIWIMGPSPYGGLFAIIMALITYVLMNGVRNGVVLFKVRHSKVTLMIPEIIWVAFLIIALLLSFTYTPYDVEFVSWSEISSLSLLRALALYPLVIFYPGYCIVNLLVRGKSRMSLAETITLSILVSYFFSGIVGFLVWLVTGAVSFGTSYLIILTNVFLLMLTLIQRHAELEKEPRDIDKSLDLFIVGIVGGALFFTFSGVYAVFMPDHFTHGFDTWDLWGIIHITIAGTPEISGYNYFLFKFYSALLVASSGLPLINAYMLAFFLASLRVVAFYAMCSSIIAKRQAALATLVYATFSGLAGLYAIFSRIFLGMDFWSALWWAGTRCYDIESGVQGYSFFYQPINLVYAFPFIFLHLAFSRNYPRFARVILMTFSFASGYLTELTVIPILLAIVFLLVLFNMKIINKVSDVCLSQLMGIMVSFGIFYGYTRVLPVSIGGYNSPLIMFFPYLLVTIVAALALSCLKGGAFGVIKSYKVIRDKLASLSDKIGWSGRTNIRYKAHEMLSVICIYFLLVLLIFWIYIPPYLQNFRLFGGTVPWIFYPVKFGLPLFISIAMVPYISKKGDSNILRLGVIILFAAVAAGNLESFLTERNLAYVGHTETRWLIWSWGGISILASYGIHVILRNIAGQFKLFKRIAFIFILVFVLVASSSGTLLTIEYYRSYIGGLKIPIEEVNDLYALRSVLDANALVAGPDWRAQSRMEYYAARLALDEAWQPLFVTTTNPAFLPDVLLNTPHATTGLITDWYLFEPTRSSETVLLKGLTYRFLSNYLPSITENEWFKLYKLPAMSPSSFHSETAFIGSLLQSEVSRYKIIADDNQRKFWKLGFEHSGDFGLKIEESSTEKVMGETSLLLNVTRGSYGRVMVYHDYEGPQDWSEYDSISLYWYGTGSGQPSIGVIIYAPDAPNQIWFQWDDDFFGWKKLSIPLREMGRHGTPDLSRVRHIEVRLFPTVTNVYYLDGLVLEIERLPISEIYTKGEIFLQFGLSMSHINYTVFSMVDSVATSPGIKTILMAEDLYHPPERLLNWIRNGGTLVIFQGEGWKTFPKASREISEAESNYVLRFDGEDDYVKIPNAESLRFGTGSFSLELWVNVKNTSRTNERLIYTFDPKIEKGFMLYHDLGRFVFETWNPAAKISSGFVQANEWYHVVFVRDITATNKFKIYVNAGAPQEEHGHSADVTTKESYFIGSDFTLSNLFKGLIDEVRMYNKALDPREIAWNYVNKGRIYNDTGLVLWLKLGEGRGNIAYDESGFNNGILFNSPEWIEYESSSPLEAAKLGFFSRELGLSSKNNILVNDLFGPGGFVHLPLEIKGYAINWGKETTPIAWYTKNGNQITPYALQKNFGNGKVVYLIATPFVEALRANTEEARALFPYLKELIEVLELPIQKYQESSRSTYAFIIDAALLNDGKIRARSLLSVEAGLLRESMNLKNVDILTENSELKNVTLRECQIENLKNFQIAFKRASISPPHMPSYVNVQLEGGFNLTLVPEQGRNITLYVEDGNHTLTISTQKAVRLNIHSNKEEEMRFYLREAEFDVRTAHFDKILFDFYGGINCPGIPMSVEGGMKFIVKNVEEKFILATDVNIEGTYRVKAFGPSVYYPIRESRWLFPKEAILSPIFYLLTVATSVQIIRILKRRSK